MTNRQQLLLKFIIKEYIKNADPIGSDFVVKKGKFALSPATVRNEMMELEKQGYISQPHTSAGRIPTEKGYKFYIQNYLDSDQDKVVGKGLKKLENTTREKNEDETAYIKNLAKNLAEISSGAVMIGFGPNNVYYTGLTNLFSQPEFQDLDLVHNISSVMDHLDEVIDAVFEKIGDEAEIMIGNGNPFGDDCGAVITKYGSLGTNSGILGIIGPMRMDYGNNLNLIRYAQKLLEELK
jgi:heat-inducible transcriptional repressor